MSRPLPAECGRVDVTSSCPAFASRSAHLSGACRSAHLSGLVVAWWRQVRLLHTRLGDGDGGDARSCRTAWCTQAHCGHDRGVARWQPLPLHGLPSDPAGDGSTGRCSPCACYALARQCSRARAHAPILHTHQAFKEEFASVDIEDLGCTDCHDVRTKQPCARECDRAVQQATSQDKPRACCDKKRVELVTEPPLVAVPLAPARTLMYTDSEHGLSYYKPASLPALIDVLKAHPSAVIVCANTGMVSVAVSRIEWRYRPKPYSICTL